MSDKKIRKEDFESSPFPDGTLCLSCGDDAHGLTDLVFATGAYVVGDPDIIDQQLIIDFILAAINAYNPE